MAYNYINISINHMNINSAQLQKLPEKCILHTLLKMINSF